jgi:hypothetical protein
MFFLKKLVMWSSKEVLSFLIVERVVCIPRNGKEVACFVACFDSTCFLWLVYINVISNVFLENFIIFSNSSPKPKGKKGSGKELAVKFCEILPQFKLYKNEVTKCHE